MSSELIEEGGVIDTGSDEVLLTNGANETDEGVAEYLEEVKVAKYFYLVYKKIKKKKKI